MAVIGAGVGGLVAALELASAGCDVTVLEATATPGGKLRQVHCDGQALDAGPTVFTMRWVFDRLFDDLGLHLPDHLVLRPLQVLARHAWEVGGRLDLLADVDASVDAIGRFAGAADAAGYRAFCERGARMFRTLDGSFMQRSRPNPVSLAWRCGVRGLPDLAAISPFSTLWDELGRHFRDPRLRQLFGRYATYCGSSPFLAPATLMLVAHVEQAGVWSLDGGMHTLARVLARLAALRGATLRFDSPVAAVVVRDGRAAGVRLADGSLLEAEAVVHNGDVAALADGLLGPDAQRAVGGVPRSARSLSALTWNLTARCRGLPLSRHTVCFGADSASEFDTLVRGRSLPARPTVYVCAQDRGDGLAADAAPPATERLLVLVNAPPDGDLNPLPAEELARCQRRAFDLLTRCGLPLEPASPPVVTTPTDFARMFPGTGGALYGRASHGWRASFSRPGSRSRLPGLYLAGGSAHPGPGVPMAALSGRLAAQALGRDLSTRRGSTFTWAGAATPGGMSTP